MRIVIAGEGAIARKHLAAVARIEDVEVVSIAGGNAADTERLAAESGIGHWSLDLDECLARPGVEAVVLATPTPLHAAQTVHALEAGRHTLVEIPMADSLADAQAVVDAAAAADRIAMVCHTRRFNPSHRWIHDRLTAGRLALQHLVVETFFLRRENRNALGQPRDWTDHLLWHHACHTVDLFRHQTGEDVAQSWALQGPSHPELAIAMDMSIGMATSSGSLCTLALSFNNDGPLGTTFRYICDQGTYVARYDDLVDGSGTPVDVATGMRSADGIELQDREFFASVIAGREPEASVAQCLPTMRTLDRLADDLEGRRP